jgi:hypothetical protein
MRRPVGRPSRLHKALAFVTPSNGWFHRFIAVQCGRKRNTNWNLFQQS